METIIWMSGLEGRAGTKRPGGHAFIKEDVRGKAILTAKENYNFPL
jgi:hypothetical protein